MTIHFDREIYFDAVRGPLFGGSMTQGQVAGQESILLAWEENPLSDDLRHLAYCLATTKHETANEMLPIEEYGKGAGQPYGVPDSETGQTYYGRGFVQLTWRENYARATEELDLSGDNDLEWHASGALVPEIAAEVMFRGMMEGWFRSPNTLPRFFNETTNDAYGAREIVNGDKHIVPSWSNGVSIGRLIAGYHEDFLDALIVASQETVPVDVVQIAIDVPANVRLEITVNGEALAKANKGAQS
jgi:putative chitinase